MKRYRHVTALLLAALVILISGACSGSDDPIAAGRDAPDARPTGVPAPAGVGPNGEVLTLEVVTVDGFAIVTDNRGMAVYGNERDTPDSIFCVDPDCEAAWPPLRPADAFISSLLDVTQYSVTTRPDGTAQVVYAGHPLYLWSGDSRVGIPGGAGVAGIWFALTPNGAPVY